MLLKRQNSLLIVICIAAIAITFGTGGKVIVAGPIIGIIAFLILKGLFYQKNTELEYKKEWLEKEFQLDEEALLKIKARLQENSDKWRIKEGFDLHWQQLLNLEIKQEFSLRITHQNSMISYIEINAIKRGNKISATISGERKGKDFIEDIQSLL